jgi:hypothetical protein
VTGELSRAERDNRRRSKRREEILRWSVRVLLVLLVLAVGIAIGEALHDNPRAGETVTFERTLSIPSVPTGSTATP